MSELESQKKRRTPEEIVDLIYDALSESNLMTVKAISVLSGIDRETCKRNLDNIAHIQNKQGIGWLEVQEVMDENQETSQTLYKKVKKKRKR